MKRMNNNQEENTFESPSVALKSANDDTVLSPTPFRFKTSALRQFLEGSTTMDKLPQGMGGLAFELREEVEPLLFVLDDSEGSPPPVSKEFVGLDEIEKIVDASKNLVAVGAGSSWSLFEDGVRSNEVEVAQDVLDTFQFWFEEPHLSGPYVRCTEVGFDPGNGIRATPGNVSAALGLGMLDHFCLCFEDLDRVESMYRWGLMWNFLSQAKFLNAALIGSHLQRWSGRGDRDCWNRVIHTYARHPLGTTGMRTCGYGARPMTGAPKHHDPVMDYCLRALRRQPAEAILSSIRPS
jgi:hypothetical protein